MKVSTITCHNVYNHGALLQAWALAIYLNSEGEECSIIDYQPKYLSGQYDFKINNEKYNRPLIKWLYMLAKYPLWRKELRRKKNFDLFFSKNIRPLLTPQSYTTLNELKTNPPVSDVYIAGSDQIWNTKVANGNDSAFYLGFGESTVKRISYAASFSTDSLVPKSKEFVKKQLSIFNAISVREASGVKILKELGFTGSVVVDPVFLIDPNRWADLTADIVLPTKYILIYDTNRSKELEVLAKRYAKITGLPIYSISGFKLPYANNKYRMGGPDVFLALIKNADCVISNSFHASAFSIIFNRNFIVVKRPDGLNRRMEDLLSSYGLSSRLMKKNDIEVNLLSQIKYKEVNKQMERHRVMSADWLRYNIGNSN